MIVDADAGEMPPAYQSSCGSACMRPFDRSQEQLAAAHAKARRIRGAVRSTVAPAMAALHSAREKNVTLRSRPRI